MKVKKEAHNFRSNCPLSLGLDLFGDKWSLLIVRDLLYYKERTFKDFSLAKEKILPRGSQIDYQNWKI
ncbi:hypothetical protein [uncultured Tenacibaculum sp.]|uniref:winged helix-turn-helix transcriptional regulator n=1 Tax=uncultured Tenacibaculum sp. TaxID=174713 RepID=UPI0026391737|nr:hypothetical protein [uncultured Tenacibaculum sp.]